MMFQLQALVNHPESSLAAPAGEPLNISEAKLLRECMSVPDKTG